MNTDKKNRLKITIADRGIDDLSNFEELGFIFENNKEKGTITVFIPPNWSIKAGDKEEKVFIVDDKGRKRGYYFTGSNYNGSPICLLSRYTIETEIISRWGTGTAKEARFVINDNASDTICYIGKTINLRNSPSLIKDEINNIESYLKTNYPKSDKKHEYWD